MKISGSMQKVLEAARSGEYKQVGGMLRIRDCFCFMGLLCEVYRRETGNGEWVPNVSPSAPMLAHSFHVGNAIHNVYLPHVVRDWLAPPHGLTIQMVAWNDAELLSFTEIADSVETYYAEAD